MFHQAFVLFTSLLTLFNPASVIAPFVSHTRTCSPAVQHAIARRVAISATVTMIATTWVGRYFLRALGISLPALQLTGGFILLLAALPMVTRASKASPEPAAEISDTAGSGSIAAVPLTFPLTVGGATVAAIVTAGTGREMAIGWLSVMTAVCSMMGIVIWLTYRFAPAIARRLGAGGLVILSTIGGIVLLSISFQILATGLGGLFPEDLRPSIPKT